MEYSCSSSASYCGASAGGSATGAPNRRTRRAAAASKTTARWINGDRRRHRRRGARRITMSVSSATERPSTIKPAPMRKSASWGLSHCTTHLNRSLVPSFKLAPSVSFYLFLSFSSLFSLLSSLFSSIFFNEHITNDTHTHIKWSAEMNKGVWMLLDATS